VSLFISYEFDSKFEMHSLSTWG